MQSEISRRENMLLFGLIMVAMLIVGAVLDTIALLVTYRVVAAYWSAMPAEVAAAPGTWALWISLVRLPLLLIVVLLRLRPYLRRFFATSEFPEAPQFQGLRHFVHELGGAGLDGLLTAAAALVVLGYGARLPVNGEFIKLLALSAVGAYLLSTSPRWLVKALRWSWRRLRTTPVIRSRITRSPRISRW